MLRRRQIQNGKLTGLLHGLEALTSFCQGFGICTN
jgi:hypothetical protein